MKSGDGVNVKVETTEEILSGQWPQSFSMLNFDNLSAHLELQIFKDKAQPSPTSTCTYSKMNNPDEMEVEDDPCSDSINAPSDINVTYYNLLNERITHQPSMLKAGTLRDYQLVGLQWMISLNNINLNGILVDEMGLGKIIQVMVFITYLVEFKRNYGPHLLIVPNSVIGNWQSELQRWPPSLSSIFNVDSKDQHAKLWVLDSILAKFERTSHRILLFSTMTKLLYILEEYLQLRNFQYTRIDGGTSLDDRESAIAEFTKSESPSPSTNKKRPRDTMPELCSYKKMKFLNSGNEPVQAQGNDSHYIQWNTFEAVHAIPSTLFQPISMPLVTEPHTLDTQSNTSKLEEPKRGDFDKGLKHKGLQVNVLSQYPYFPIDPLADFEWQFTSCLLPEFIPPSAIKIPHH